MSIPTIRFFVYASFIVTAITLRPAQSQEHTAQGFPFQILSNTNRTNDESQLGRPELLRSPFSESQPAPVGFDLAKLIRRSLLFSGIVVAACLALAFVSQQKRKHRGTSSHQINVLETQMLGPRCFGDLVQIREQYLFVARDASGIKSVVPLTVAFDTELDGLDESTVDESPSQPIDSFRSRNQNETWPTKLPSRTM